MMIEQFLTHIRSQLEHVRCSGFTHAQKDGALGLIQLEIDAQKITIQEDIDYEMKKLREEMFRSVQRTFEWLEEALDDTSPEAPDTECVREFLKEKEGMYRKMLIQNYQEFPF